VLCDDAGVDEIVTEVLKVAAGLLGAVVVALLSPLFRTSRRLRDELRAEAQFVERVPSGARAELRSEIARRTHLLVSLTRHPPVTRADVLTIGSWSVYLAVGVWMTLNIVDVPLADALMAVAAMVTFGLGVLTSHVTTSPCPVAGRGGRPPECST
jgi:hypothetical protein